MKIVFLNIWGGRMYEPLMAFLRAHAPAADFFCLQEVFDSPHQREVSWGGRADILTELTRTLPDFTSYYSPAVEGSDGDIALDFKISVGLATFVRRGITVLTHGDIPIHEAGAIDASAKGYTNMKTILQYVRFPVGKVIYTVVSLHGIALPGSKIDTTERLAQSRAVIDFLAGEKGEKILGGDFNLMPDTESIRMIERAGMRNLITECGITATRNPLSYGQYAEHDRQYFADYAFVSAGIAVKDFVVPQIEVSDHLPLILEFA